MIGGIRETQEMLDYRAERRIVPRPWPDASFERRCLLGAAFLLLLAAWLSIGFHHNDEHFQLLEFANFKLGVTPATDLPWEFHDRIRSWFQPVVVLVTLKGLHFIGVTNPFHVVALLRLLSGALYLWALARLIRCSRQWFHSPEIGRHAVLVACFLWFVPYIAVRFSSESWAGALFFLGFASLIRQAQGEEVSIGELGVAGFAMGLAFAARFQAGILIAAALGWFVWAGRPRATGVVAVMSGLGVAIGASLLLDRWGYGEWVFTPWRYLNIQLIGGRAADRFGAFPWWWYFPKILLSAGPPIGLAVLAGVVLAWVKKPGSPLTWVTLPFFLTHCVLAHKELRFLFPLVLSAPFLGFLALQRFPAATRWLFHTRPGRSVWVALTVLNVAAFAIRMLIPARQEIGVQRAIYNSTPKRLLTLRGKDPFIMGGLPSYFYRDPDLRTLSLTDASGHVVAEALRQPALLVTYPLEPADTADLNCEILYRTLPVWAQREPVWSRLQWAEPQPWTLARCVAR